MRKLKEFENQFKNKNLRIADSFKSKFKDEYLKDLLFETHRIQVKHLKKWIKGVLEKMNRWLIEKFMKELKEFENKNRKFV